MFDEKINKITTELDGIRESLMTFPNEIWKDIGPDDLSRIEKYANFKREINSLIADFDRISKSLNNSIQHFLESPANNKEYTGISTDEGELLRILGTEKAHYVNENFTFTGKKPYAIILEDKPYLLNAWSAIYVQICRHFLTTDRDKMLEYTSRQRRFFSNNIAVFGTGGKELEANLFVDTGLSAKDTGNRIIILFNYFHFPYTNLKIFIIGDSDTGYGFQGRNKNFIDLDFLA